MIRTARVFVCAVTLTATTSAWSADGGSAQCKNGQMVRKVEIAQADAAQPNSCAVSYLKETETPGATQILWQAKNDKDFCASKAKAFVEKLQSMGWTCEGELAGAAAATR
jgi:hypothetical protein